MLVGLKRFFFARSFVLNQKLTRSSAAALHAGARLIHLRVRGAISKPDRSRLNLVVAIAQRLVAWGRSTSASHLICRIRGVLASLRLRSAPGAGLVATASVSASPSAAGR